MCPGNLSETLKELADLYAIQDNLNYWSDQAIQHMLVLREAEAKTFSDKIKNSFEASIEIRNKLIDQSQELRLHTLTLEVEDQKRFQVLLKSMEKELNGLDDRINQLKSVKEPYSPPKNTHSIVKQKHRQIQEHLERTQEHIEVLEPILRNLVNSELDKHEERMRYYWAQSRLAKARLYDSTLLELERARTTNPKKSPEEQP